MQHDVDRQVDYKNIPTKLPDSWRWARLGEVCDVVNGFAFAEHFQGKADRRYPFIKVSDMNADGAESVVTRATNTIDEFTLKLLRAKTYPAGTVIFPKVGGALLTNKKRILGLEATFDNNIMGVIPKTVESKWLYYWMQIIDLRKFSNTQALPSIRKSEVAALEIPLPPLPEQKRISAILQEQMATVDQVRAATEAQLKAAKALPAAYLRAIFDSPEAQRWPKKRLGEILELRKEVVHPYDNPTGPSRFVGLEHIESGTGIRNGIVLVEMSQLTGRKPRFYKGDIVYGYLRPYLNKVWIAEFDGLCSVDQYVYKVDEVKADTTFIAWFMRSPLYLERAPIGTTPGQLPRIRTEEVSAVELNLPPLSEQHRLAAMLQEKMAEVEQLRKVLVGQLDAINKLPAALLTHAFNGEL